MDIWIFEESDIRRIFYAQILCAHNLKLVRPPRCWENAISICSFSIAMCSTGMCGCVQLLDLERSRRDIQLNKIIIIHSLQFDGIVSSALKCIFLHSVGGRSSLLARRASNYNIIGRKRETANGTQRDRVHECKTKNAQTMRQTWKTKTLCNSSRIHVGQHCISRDVFKIFVLERIPFHHLRVAHCTRRGCAMTPECNWC